MDVLQVQITSEFVEDGSFQFPHSGAILRDGVACFALAGEGDRRSAVVRAKTPGQWYTIELPSLGCFGLLRESEPGGLPVGAPVDVSTIAELVPQDVLALPPEDPAVADWSVVSSLYSPMPSDQSFFRALATAIRYSCPGAE